MSDDVILTEAEGLEVEASTIEPVAMIYRNEYNEVSHIVGSDLSAGADGDFSRIFLVLVLSLVAMVVISRRPTDTKL